ncbi:MAG: NAD-dependent epimerase/dehydratase family protein [Actinobacteria bacterium]|nr:MAG: NAD-dependent epimerase/dehydratase family protein [Actinomycetota bacterium]
MRILVTGITGYVGAALAPRLLAAGHEVVGYARDPSRVTLDVPVVAGDAVAGTGLDEAFDGARVAYYLIHSMEPGDQGFDVRDRAAAQNFAAAAQRAGVERVVYLGGLVPPDRAASLHLRSRLEVEETVIAATPASVALRASVVVGPRSRSFRFLVRLVERLRLLPLPAWRDFRTQPIDGRDVLAFLVAAATSPAAAGKSLDIAGPDVLTYGEVVERIAEHLLVGRAPVRLPFNATPLASRVAATIAGEDHALIGPLMESLEGDLLPRDMRAPELLGVRLHTFDAAVERALRDMEQLGEPLVAR